MANEVTEDDRGIACPTCGCKYCPEVKGSKPFEVLRSDPLGPNQSKQRKLKCRHCGRVFLTRERVVGQPDSASA